MVRRGRPQAAEGSRRRAVSLPSLPRRRSFAVPLAAAAAAAALGGCELDDVAIPESGARVIVVHAVMRPDEPQQFVVVEQAFSGVIPFSKDRSPLPRGVPDAPIENAAVTLANVSFPEDPCGATVVFDARPVSPRHFVLPGIYWGPVGCPTMRPGDVLELRVETPAGDVVTGRTVIPGLSGATLTLHGVARPFGSDTVEFNRDRDTLLVRAEASHFRSLQIEVRRSRQALFEPGGSGFDLTLRTFVDTAALRVPGDIRDLFDRGTGEESFLGGRNYLLVAAVSDTNYFDFIRSRNNDITGRGFVNRLDGGIGVFGSVLPLAHRLRVVADADDRREGRYRLQGTIDTVDVDLTLEVYLARPLADAEFHAFAIGTWAWLGPFGPAGAAAWAPLAMRDASLDGRFTADGRMEAVIPCADQDKCFIEHFVLRGLWDPVSFGVAVHDSTGISGTLRLATLSATRE